MTSSVAPPKPSDNLQGLIARGYTHPASCHLLFAFGGSRSAAAAFLRALMPYVQSGAWGSEKPEKMLNIALSYSGIATASNLTPSDLKGFPSRFKDGPTAKDAQLALGDRGDSEFPNWWGGAFTNAVIDCVVHAYALTADVLAAFVATIAAAAASAGVRELYRIEQQYLPDDLIHFGYRDGISEPDLGWPTEWPPAGTYTDPGTLNNFVIGYPGSAFSPGPSAGNAGAFAKDGCYLAFRVISQDTAGFEKFLEDNSPNDKELLAAKVMGRWRNGSPLILSPDAPSDATRDSTVYSYADDAGKICPYSAHTRVANPRDQQIDSVDAPVPRLIRRGVVYGSPEGTGDRGLVGLFLCGSLAGQFELICSWINTNNFSDVFSPGFNTQDAMAANRLQPGADTSFMNLPLRQFLTTRGTAYCLLPSMTTLRSLAG